MPDSSNLEPPRLRSAFHGRGAAAYASVEATRQYARSLLRTSEKLFLAPLAALIASAISGYTLYVVGLWLVALALFGMAAYGALRADHLRQPSKQTRRLAQSCPRRKRRARQECRKQ